MEDLREQLHALVNELPDHELEHAKLALMHCRDREEHKRSVEQAKRHVQERSKRHLEEHARRLGRGMITSIGSGAGMTFFDGDHHSSMAAFEDGKDVTYHLFIFRGHKFEIIERYEMTPDGKRVVRQERIKGGNGEEQTVTVEIPTE